MKQKICLVCDVPNWAFDLIAKEVKKNLNHKYDIRIAYYDMRAEPDNFYEFLQENDDCDLIHFLWRKSLIQIETDTFKNKVLDSGKTLQEYIEEKRNKISFGISDFLFLDEENIDKYKNIFNLFSKNYCVSTKSLYEIYSNITQYRKPLQVVHDICDYSSFVPINIERFENFNRELVIGWVGNGSFRMEAVDLKGFHSIIKPVIKELKDEGYNIVENYADRNVRWRSKEEMPAYYSEIDICICASIHEGTPLPVLEAMSCGVPIISTNVGVVSEAFGEKQKEYIVGSRENGKNDQNIKSILKQKIIELYKNREMLKELSAENQKSIVEFDGGKIIKEYEKFFDYCLNAK